jgi:hypothetical protein
VVGSGAVYHASRDRRAGTAPSYCSKGYPCFRVSTITYEACLNYSLSRDEIPDGDLSPRGTGKKCLPQTFVRIPTRKIFRRRNGDVELKPDGEFLILSLTRAQDGTNMYSW